MPKKPALSETALELVARRFAVHLPEWVPTDRVGSVAAMVLILGMLVFAVRIIVGLLKAPADADPSHPAG